MLFKLMRWICFALIINPFQPLLASCLGLNCTCGIAATPIAFGTYNPLSGTNVNVTGNVAITCSAAVLGLLVSYEIQLSTGASGSYTNRTMTSSSNILNYNIYADAARTSIWGNNAGGTVSVSDNYLLNISPTTRNYTTYGRVVGAQNALPGSYSDTIVATVIF